MTPGKKVSLGAKTYAMPCPVWLIGSYDDEARPNIMTASWAGICCSAPPCVTVSLRKATYSFHGIMAHRAFTVNVPSADRVAQADYAGIVSGRAEDKFDRTGLTPVRSDLVDAPFVAECPLVLECKLTQAFELGLHTQFIGEIMDVKADQNVIGTRGLPDMKRINPFLYCPTSRDYFALGEWLCAAHSAGKTLKEKA